MATALKWARIALALSLLAAAGPVAAAEEVFRLRDPGEMLSEMTLADLDGRNHTLKPDGLDGPVLIFFWSVYCPNCKEAIPPLVELSTRYGPDRLTIWAINVDGERFSNAVHAYVRGENLPFPVVFDRLEGEYLVAADPLGVSKTPTLYLVGPDGRIVLRQVIQMDFDRLSAALEALVP